MITDILFTAFTIVFLTWLLRARENGQWKLVESKVRQRIRKEIMELGGAIHIDFLYPQGDDYVIEKLGPLEPQVRWRQRIELGMREIIPDRNRHENSLYAEYFANQNAIKIDTASPSMKWSKANTANVAVA